MQSFTTPSLRRLPDKSALFFQIFSLDVSVQCFGKQVVGFYGFGGPHRVIGVVEVTDVANGGALLQPILPEPKPLQVQY